MKKTLLGLCAITVLTGCSAISSTPVETPNNIKHICIRNVKSQIPDFADYLATSLQKKGIKSEKMKNYAGHCKYGLSYTVRADNHANVRRAKLILNELQNGQRVAVLGSISYKQRGEEKQKARNEGIQAQTDTMIAELFPNK
ncbi:lipoprotein [Cricetibacter osteomyelitidis]|nr:lipoprotein [Cricetibacter osteomyelitidis]